MLYHKSNSRECMGVNGFYKLHSAARLSSCMQFIKAMFTVSHTRICIGTASHTRWVWMFIMHFTSKIHPPTPHLHIYLYHPTTSESTFTSTTQPHLSPHLPLPPTHIWVHIYLHYPPTHTPLYLGTNQFPSQYLNPIFHLQSRTSTHECSVASEDPTDKRGERKEGRVAKMMTKNIPWHTIIGYLS